MRLKLRKLHAYHVFGVEHSNNVGHRQANNQSWLLLYLFPFIAIAITLLLSGSRPAQAMGTHGQAFNSNTTTPFSVILSTTPSTTASATPTLTPTSTAACGLAWRIVSSPNVVGFSSFAGFLATVTPDDIWSVGTYRLDNFEYRPLIEHWDGTEWSIVPTPDAPNGQLGSVTAISTDDVWAVGMYQNPTRTLTMHWNGTEWSIVPSPNVDAGASALYGVEAISTDDVWAVGYYGIGGGANTRTLTMHWDGTQWSIVPSPNPSQDSQGLEGVTAIASDDVWAVGGIGDRSLNLSITLIMHWDGTQWSVVQSPNPGYSNHLTAVEAASTNDVWTVGTYSVTSPRGPRTLIEHWDGSQWSIVPSPNVGPDEAHYFKGIIARSANDVWAVGDYYGINYPNYLMPMVLHWDGNQWSLVDVPMRGLQTVLVGVAPLSPTNIWMGGVSDDGTRVTTFYIRYNDPCTTPTPTIIPITPTLTSTQPPITATLTSAVTSTAIPTAAVTSTPCTITFSDVDINNSFYSSIRCLACRGIVSGYADGTFRPNNQVTRGQLAKMVSNSAGFNDPVSGQTFEDVPSTNTFYVWIERLTIRGYMTGYNCGGPGEPCLSGKPYFRPFANATRGQSAKIVSNAAGFTETPSGQTFEDVPPSNTFYPFIQRLASRNVMGGYPCGGPGEPCLTGKPYFRPNNDVTRGQSAKIVANSFFPDCVTP